MAERLDRLLDRLRARPVDRALDGLEVEVGWAIARLREQARTVSALAVLRPIAVSIALLLGVTAGMVATLAAMESHRVDSLSFIDQLPSRLLEGAR